MTLLTPSRLSVLIGLCGLMTVAAQNPPAKVIEAIELRGVSGVPAETLKAAVLSKVGDVYDQEALRRDFTALWKTGRFTDIQLKTEPGAHGGVIVRFDMTQGQAPQLIEAIEFQGIIGVAADTLKAAVLSKIGDVYDEEALRRDFTALWKTNLFSDIQLKKDTGAHGGVIVRFIVTER